MLAVQTESFLRDRRYICASRTSDSSWLILWIIRQEYFNFRVFFRHGRSGVTVALAEPRGG